MDDIAPPPETPNLRFLRRLVTVLTGTMIFGVLTIVVLLVIRLQTPPGPVAPDHLQLPPNTAIYAVTQAPDAWIVVTQGHQILIFSSKGVLENTITFDSSALP